MRPLSLSRLAKEPENELSKLKADKIPVSSTDDRHQFSRQMNESLSALLSLVWIIPKAKLSLA